MNNVFGSPPKSTSSAACITPQDKESLEDGIFSVKDGNDAEITENLPPVVITQYVDITTSETMALVLLTLPSGVTSCTVTVDPDSLTKGTGGTNSILVSYEWGECSFNPLRLYQKKIKQNKMNENDPKIQAIYNGVKNIRSNVKQAPVSTITIKLPFTVQVADNKWSYNTIANKDKSGFTSQVLEVELTELQTSYTSIKSNEKATFQLD